jgi:hypothetical protein
VRSPTGAFGGEGGAVEDHALAERALPRQSDFPPGWRSTPNDESADPELQQLLVACLKVDPALVFQGSSSVESQHFELEDARQEVQSAVAVVEKPEQARARLATFERPETAGCVNVAVSESIRRGTEAAGGLPSGVTFGTVATERVAFPTVGDGTVAYRVTMPLEAVGRQAAVYADVVVAIKGRSGTRMTFLSLGAPFPGDLAQRLTETVVGRLPAP